MEYFTYNSEPKTIEFKRGIDNSWTLQDKLLITACIANGHSEQSAVQEIYNRRYNESVELPYNQESTHHTKEEDSMK